MKKRSLLLVLLAAIMLVFAPVAMAAELPVAETVDVSAVVPGDGTIVVTGRVDFGTLADGVNTSGDATVTVTTNCMVNTQFEGEDLSESGGNTIAATYAANGSDFTEGSPYTFSGVPSGESVYIVNGETASITLAGETVGAYSALITVTVSQ